MLKIFDGDLDGAMEILKAMAERYGFSWSLETHPALDPLREREDFKAVFAELTVHINAERAKLGWEPVE